MKEIRKFEELMTSKENISLKEAGVNSTLYWAYRTTREESKNDLLDFDDGIWDYDIPEIAKTLKKEGIKEFTISSTFSGLIATLAKFEEQGIVMNGLTTINARYKDWATKEHQQIPAIKMLVKED
ncbi:hypothetical protein P261_02612 [Lachnospiraceae bacterium TWA4]|nr:hypothetical protein P261_02612 [Lachnospiraceae bacterium TWA4]